MESDVIKFREVGIDSPVRGKWRSDATVSNASGTFEKQIARKEKRKKLYEHMPLLGVYASLEVSLGHYSRNTQRVDRQMQSSVDNSNHGHTFEEAGALTFSHLPERKKKLTKLKYKQYSLIHGV